MKIGLQIVRFDWPGNPKNNAEMLRKIAQLTDQGGFSSLWVMDHFYQLDPMMGKVDDPMMEGYSILNYLAGLTQNIKLGTLVTGVIYRNPSYLVKLATTLDVLSNGRAYLGIGAGWYEREAQGLGFQFPPLKERFERLEENLQIAHHLWSGNKKPFKGKFHQLLEPINNPQPITKPHPPILIGGGGEKKTLRYVAKYGDACNLFARIGRDEIKRKLEVLKRHCDVVGTSYDEIEKTTSGSVHLNPENETPADVIALCRQFSEVGIDHMIFNMPNYHEIKPIEVFINEIIPEVRDL